LSDIEPVITAVSHVKPSSPQTHFLTAHVEDDQGIANVEARFQWAGSVQVDIMVMHDDGLHMDGGAGDGTFGVALPWTDSSAILTYILSARDLNANESLYPVCGARQLLLGGASVTLVINEIMADNESTVQDDQGDFDDWVEIFNYGAEPVNLAGLYLTDNQTNPKKWAFPEMWIGGGEYLLVWADDEPSQGPLHASFKLSADGEFIGIFDSDIRNNALIDGIDFGPQDNDVAWGRLPNGAGDFMIVQPTPGSINTPLTSISNEDASLHYVVYPNPATDLVYIQIRSPKKTPHRIALYNVFGQTVMEQVWEEPMLLDVKSIPTGIYMLSLRGEKRIDLRTKIIIQK